MVKNRSLALFLILIAFFLLFSLKQWFFNVDADAYIYPVQILEITENGTTELDQVKAKLPNVTVETMSMKRFVALRGDLDGKYDAIYIGSGSYSTDYPKTFSSANKTEQTKAHDTSGVMNDITHLKADEIVNKYLNKGFPVLLHEDIWNQKANMSKDPGDRRILYDTFIQYRYTRPNNVLIVKDSDLTSSRSGTPALATTLKSSVYDAMLKQRPRLTLTEKPSSTAEYVTGQELVFKFKVNNAYELATHPLNANLYLSVDSVFPMGTDQLVSTVSVASASDNILKYTLPKGYSGPLYWRLEIVNSLSESKLKDFEGGSIFFKGEKTIVRVLQIMPDNNNSSLKNENRNYTNNMNQSYLGNENYQINIETKLSSDFNKAAVYGNLNGKYDMLIFGFRDEYNQFAQMSESAAKAIEDFIATGQSVMFTHDTVFNDSADNSNKYWRLWLDHFQVVTGQNQLMTNLGYGNPVSSTMTVPVNQGLLTQYPYPLSVKPTAGSVGQIASTHNQYFMLDLENETVVPWYNIQGGNRDPFDSWNHYYTYSKGNVTYSGTGHTNTGFPEWEQKLFVNTMYRAFMGSNHAPAITVHSPLKDSKIASYHQVVVSYTVNDLDLQDRKLFTGITFKYMQDGKQFSETMLPEKQVLTGETVTMTFANPLPEGGNLTVEIMARDKSNATAVETIELKVEKVSANLLTERSLSANVVNNKVAKNAPVAITYKITPKPVPNYSGDRADNVLISGISFNEALPINLEVSSISLPTIKKSGSLNSGYTLAGSIPNIVYRLSADKKEYIADPVTFTVNTVPTKNGVYSLTNSALTFTDIGEIKAKTISFPPLVFEAVTLITRLSLDDATILVGDKNMMIPVIEPADASNKILTWKSSDPSKVTVNEYGQIEGKQAGDAKITIGTTDGSNLQASAIVRVINPDLSITGPDTVKVGESITLKASLVTTGEKVTSVEWSLKEAKDSSFAGIGSLADQWQREITGKKSGLATVVVKVKTQSLSSSETREYRKEFIVKIVNPIIGVQIVGPSGVKVGGSADLQAIITPLDADPEPFIWSLVGNEDGTFAKLEENGDKALLTGKKMGSVTVKVQTGNATATLKVDIGPVLTALRLPGEISLKEGETFSLQPELRLYPDSVTLQEIIGDLHWQTSSDSNVSVIAEGNQGGKITAIKRGYSIIKVTYGPKPSIYAEVTVKVTSKANSNRY